MESIDRKTLRSKCDRDAEVLNREPARLVEDREAAVASQPTFENERDWRRFLRGANSRRVLDWP